MWHWVSPQLKGDLDLPCPIRPSDDCTANGQGHCGFGVQGEVSLLDLGEVNVDQITHLITRSTPR